MTNTNQANLTSTQLSDTLSDADSGRMDVDQASSENLNRLIAETLQGKVSIRD